MNRGSRGWRLAGSLIAVLGLTLTGCGGGDPAVTIDDTPTIDAGGNLVTTPDEAAPGTTETGSPSTGTGTSRGTSGTSGTSGNGQSGSSGSSNSSNSSHQGSHPGGTTGHDVKPSCGTPPGGTQDGKARQVIRFPAIGQLMWPERQATLSACSTSGLPVAFDLVPGDDSATSCTVTGSTVRATQPVFECTVRATQSGDARYAAAPPVTRTFSVSSQVVVVSWVNAPPQTMGAGDSASISVRVTSPSGPISRSSVSVFVGSDPDDACSGPDGFAELGPSAVAAFTLTAGTLSTDGTCTVNVVVEGDQTIRGGETGTRDIDITASP